MQRQAIDLSIPAQWERGYGSFQTEIHFEDPVNPRLTATVAGIGLHKSVGILMMGAKDNFSDWDATAHFFVMKLDGLRAVRTAEDLLRLANDLCAKKTKMANGVEVDNIGSVSTKTVGGHDIVVLTRSDPYRMRKLRIKTVRGEETSNEWEEAPYQIYLVRIDDQFVFGIRVSHDSPRSRSKKWYADSERTVEALMKGLSIIKDA